MNLHSSLPLQVDALWLCWAHTTTLVVWLCKSQVWFGLEGWWWINWRSGSKFSCSTLGKRNCFASGGAYSIECLLGDKQEQNVQRLWGYDTIWMGIALVVFWCLVWCNIICNSKWRTIEWWCLEVRWRLVGERWLTEGFTNWWTLGVSYDKCLA